MNNAATAPAPVNPAHRNVAAHACPECQAAAMTMCEPYCPASLGVEFVTVPDGIHDAVECVEECGNDTGLDGFYAVRADGTPDIYCSDAWAADGEHVNCGRCGRVYSQLSPLIDGEYSQVLTQLAEPVNPV